MIRNSLPLIAAGAMMAVPVTSHAANVEIATSGPVVELTVSEVIQSAPDVARISAGVQNQAPTAREAVRQNAEAMDRLVKRIKALGIPAKDIQTSNFNLNPQYRYDRENEQQVFTGYQVNNQVSVKLRDLDRAGETLDALIEAGANNVSGPYFMLENDEVVKAAARKQAFERGKAMAQDYAQMAGYSSVRLIEVSENFHSISPMPQPMMAMRVMAEAADASTPIEAGEVGTGVTISVKYTME